MVDLSVLDSLIDEGRLAERIADVQGYGISSTMVSELASRLQGHAI